MTLLVAFFILFAVHAEAALPQHGQSRWAVGVSLRDADASSLWRIGPRFTYGLTLGPTSLPMWLIGTLGLWTLTFGSR